jgi:hypothetical protein
LIEREEQAMREPIMRETIEELLRAFTAGRSNRSRSRTAGLPRESRPHRTRTTFVATREVSPTTYLPI